MIVQLLQVIRDEQREQHQNCMNEIRKLERPVAKLTNSMLRENEFPTIPDSLPMRTREDIENFENVDDEEYKKVVAYLADLGGYNLNETANLIIKHVIQDALSPSLTWQGRERGTLRLQTTKLAKAFFSAIARNKAFQNPTLREFTDCMTAALKSCKQRNRNAVHRQGAVAGNRRQREEDLEEIDANDAGPRRRLNYNEPAA